MFAIIRLGGRQYKVSAGEVLLVDKIRDLKKIEPEVLLSSDGDKVKVGHPVLKDVKVKIKVLDELVKGEKIEVYKFKAKSRYRKHTGFRAQFTKLLVEKIG